MDDLPHDSFDYFDYTVPSNDGQRQRSESVERQELRAGSTYPVLKRKIGSLVQSPVLVS